MTGKCNTKALCGMPVANQGKHWEFENFLLAMLPKQCSGALAVAIQLRQSLLFYLTTAFPAELSSTESQNPLMYASLVGSAQKNARRDVLVAASKCGCAVSSRVSKIHCNQIYAVKHNAARIQLWGSGQNEEGRGIL